MSVRFKIMDVETKHIVETKLEVMNVFQWTFAELDTDIMRSQRHVKVRKLKNLKFKLFITYLILDINECVENLNICNNGQCNNTVGSYTCEDSYSEFKARCEESVFTTLPTTRAATTRRTTTTQRPCPQGFERNNRGICVGKDYLVGFLEYL